MWPSEHHACLGMSIEPVDREQITLQRRLVCAVEVLSGEKWPQRLGIVAGLVVAAVAVLSWLRDGPGEAPASRVEYRAPGPSPARPEVGQPCRSEDPAASPPAQPAVQEPGRLEAPPAQPMAQPAAQQPGGISPLRAWMQQNPNPKMPSLNQDEFRVLLEDLNNGHRLKFKLGFDRVDGVWVDLFPNQCVVSYPRQGDAMHIDAFGMDEALAKDATNLILGLIKERQGAPDWRPYRKLPGDLKQWGHLVPAIHHLAQ